ncbi:ABC transporter substrate-binding protein [Mesorhizobium sp. 1B3]|uniref:ABC transporter substrate-binding protein n=1 Tax=Mesorhizobium sp. 1B3 TaxID=3243599 RepID=UPI003D97AC5E
MLKSMKRRLSWALGVAIVCSSAFLGLSSSGADAQERTKLVLAVSTRSAMNYFPVYIAIAEGYFADEELEVRVEPLSSSAEVLQVLAAGKAEIGSPGPGPQLAARERGADIVAFYNYIPKNIFGLSVLAGSGITDISSLRNKKIGVNGTEGAVIGFIRSIAADSGLREGVDFEFVDVGNPGNAVAGFTRGDIDAYGGAIADFAVLTTRGLKISEITPPKFQAYFVNGWAATAKYIEANPKVIAAFGRALIRGTEFGLKKENRQRVLDVIGEVNPLEVEDMQVAAALLEIMADRLSPPERGWGHYDHAGWEAWQNVQIESGALTGPLPHLDKAYTNAFVAEWNK